MAPALLHLLSMLRVAGGCRLLSRARRDPLSQLQQQPIEGDPHPHTLLPYTRIRLYFTLLCPHLRTSCLYLSPCWYCCLRSQQTSNTQLSQLPQNTPRIGFAGLQPDKTKLLKDAPKIAVETWKPCNIESLLIQNQHYINVVGLYAHIKISDLPTSYSHLYFSWPAKAVIRLVMVINGWM